MHHKRIFVISCAVVLLFLILVPSIYINSECEKYINIIDDISFSLENNNLEKATAIYDDKIYNWLDSNHVILSLSPHERTETIDKFIIQLEYELKQGKIEDALSYCDLLTNELEHLQKHSTFALENLF